MVILAPDEGLDLVCPFCSVDCQSCLLRAAPKPYIVLAAKCCVCPNLTMDPVIRDE